MDGYIKSFLADQKTATEGISDVVSAENMLSMLTLHTRTMQNASGIDFVE